MKRITLGIIVIIILIGVVIGYGAWQIPKPPVPLEPLTIATGSGEFSALTLIADEKGYFKKYGLNVTIRN